MKKVILTLALAFTMFSINAQEDSSKINKEQNLEIELENLEDGKEEFESQIKELNKQIISMKIELQSNDISEDRKKEIEAQIADLELQVAALENGMVSIEKDVKRMQRDEENNHHAPRNDNEDGEDDDDDDDDNDDNNDEFDFDWDDFDFDFWPLNKKKKFNAHWAGFELGLTNFLNADNAFELPSNGSFLELDPVKSWNFSLNFLEFNIPLHKKYFGLVTGVGFDWKSYTLENNGSLVYDELGNIAFNEADYTLSRNKLNVNSFTFPLLAELQLPLGKKDKRVSFTGGVIGSIRVYSKTSQQWEDGKTDNFFQQEADYNLSTFKYAYTARVGFGGFQLFANYEVTPFFEKGKGPEVYPITIGFRLLNF